MRHVLRYGLAALLLFVGQPLWAYGTAECIRCHRPGSAESRLHVPLRAYEGSVHAGEAGCRDCHTGVVDASHMTGVGAGGVGCGACHEQENRHGLEAGGALRPECWSCHGSHAILSKENPASNVHPRNLEATCGRCHPEETGRAGVLPWLLSVRVRTHGKQDLSCACEASDCLGCHQGRAAHGEAGLLNDRDCHRCHLPQDGRSPLLGSIHPIRRVENPGLFRAAEALYAGAGILVALGGCAFLVARFSRRPGGSPRRKDL